MNESKPIDIQLAVLGEKMDGIKSTLDVRLNGLEAAQKENTLAITRVESHSDKGLIAQGEAFAKLLEKQAEAFSKALEKKTDKVQSEERYRNVVERQEKIDGHLTWLNRLVIGATIIAVLGGGYLASKAIHLPQNPTAITQPGPVVR